MNPGPHDNTNLKESSSGFFNNCKYQWIAEEKGVSLQLEFKPDGTIGIPNAKELGKLISSYLRAGPKNGRLAHPGGL